MRAASFTPSEIGIQKFATSFTLRGKSLRVTIVIGEPLAVRRKSAVMGQQRTGCGDGIESSAGRGTHVPCTEESVNELGLVAHRGGNAGRLQPRRVVETV